MLHSSRPRFSRRIKEHDKTAIGSIYRTAEYTLYPYNQGPQPTVDCAAAANFTDIQLQPGETITDVAIGDS